MSALKIYAPTFGTHFTDSYTSDEAIFMALAHAIDKARAYTGRTGVDVGWPWDRDSLLRLDLLRRGVKPTLSLKRWSGKYELCGWVGSPQELPYSRGDLMDPRQLLLFSVVADEKQRLLELTEEVLRPEIRSVTFYRLADTHHVVWL